MKKLALAVLAVALSACETPAPKPAPAPPPTPAYVPPERSRDAPPEAIAMNQAAPAAPVPTAPAAPETEVAYAPAALPPALTPDAIERTFRLHQRYFSKAYQERLRGKPGLTGTVLVSLTVSAEGGAQDVKILESTTRDAVFDATVARIVTQMNFPPAQGATPVASYPLNFTPPRGRK